MIAQSVIEEIESYPLAEAISKIYTDTSYKIQGNQAKGLSPFVQEKNPSFSVNSNKKVWKCFTSNISGRSVIKFVMEYKKLGYVDALKACAEALNIPLVYEQETPESREKRARKKTALEVLEKCEELFMKNLEALPNDHWAKTYMQERGFTCETLEDFRIGYSLPEQLYSIFKEQGNVNELLELGLLKNNHSSVPKNFFYKRMMFPICDAQGRCVGFAGRISPQEEQNKKAPKYLNSSESDYFNKSEILYGLHLALSDLQNKDECYLVEGYTDVMRMHQIGLKNTVATMGTALTTNHVKILKKYVSKVIIFRDFDTAGQKAAMRDVSALLKEGIFVDIIVPNTSDEKKQDPDSIGREQAQPIDYIQSLRKDAFLYKIEQLAPDGMNNTKQRKKIPPSDLLNFYEVIKETLSILPKGTIRDAYLENISYTYKVSKKDIQPKEKERATSLEYMGDLWDEYNFPYEIKDPSLYKEDIKKYGMFQTNNRIYALDGDTFTSISNFSVEIVQHMQDEKFPMKLIRLKNIFDKEVIFDTPSDRINTVNKFYDLVTSFGNFNYRNQKTGIHNQLLSYLFDKMGNGRKIEILGWQEEGFWVWNNKIIVPSEGEHPIGEEGLYKYKGISYYIPSANRQYEHNALRYTSQKKFRSMDSDVKLEDYLLQVIKVHREHGISAILFAIASLFQDVVTSKLHFFPLLFLYGKGSSGKDNLGEIIQSFVGVPQSAINLESGLSTGKASIREFAQFSNGISQLSEYKRGDKTTDGTLKSLWDRRGYKIGTLESKVSTDEVPILSSVIITGNEYPDSQPLLMRLIFEEMNKNEFTNEEITEFDKLKEWTQKGVSNFSNLFLQYRKTIEKQFYEVYLREKQNYGLLDEFKGVPSRIISNISVLTAFFKIFDSLNIRFPFGIIDLNNHWRNMISNLNAKLYSTSPMLKFWDCFLACMRIENGQCQLQLNNNIRESGGTLYFNLNTIYPIIQKQWFPMFRTTAPSKNDVRRWIKEEDKLFVRDRVSMHINPNLKRTKVMEINMEYLPNKDEIMNEIHYQRYYFPNSTNTKDIDEEEEENKKIPF